MSPPEQAAVAIAKAFLAAIAARDLERAESLTAPDFKMIVSGGHEFTSLRSFVGYSTTRQKSVAKHTERFDALAGEQGAAVYCFGTMSGTWLDGTSYQNVRYIDRFLVRGGSVAELQVWSDMAEFRPPDPAGD